MLVGQKKTDAYSNHLHMALLELALHAVEELLPALRVSDVLNAEVDTLLDVTVADDLVNNDTDCAGGHVVDDTSTTSCMSMH